MYGPITRMDGILRSDAVEVAGSREWVSTSNRCG